MRALVLVPLLALAAPATASMRCGSQLIGVGAAALQLQVACGPPAHIARHTAVTPGETKGSRVIESIETWVYPGTEGTLTRLVEVRRGRVAAIATSGYGLPTERCDSPALGTALGELELACRPAAADRSTWAEERVGPRGQLQRIITHERWVLDAGPGRLLRILEFTDGRLTQVHTGARSP